MRSKIEPRIVEEEDGVDTLSDRQGQEQIRVYVFFRDVVQPKNPGTYGGLKPRKAPKEVVQAVWDRDKNATVLIFARSMKQSFVSIGIG